MIMQSSLHALAALATNHAQNRIAQSRRWCGVCHGDGIALPDQFAPARINREHLKPKRRVNMVEPAGSPLEESLMHS